MNRTEMLHRVRDRREPWDLLVIGGGATGVGTALDAAARGYAVLLLERGDFGCGTSSRSTKLVHGGVRYLRQGQIGLVLGALRERGRLLRNAPHLVRDLAFVLPCYRRFELAKYGIGLKAYDLLAGRHRFGHSKFASANAVKRLLPTVTGDGLRGGIVYHDGQFDDARLLIHLAMTAVERGAAILNYFPVTGLFRRPDGAIGGAAAHDDETGEEFRIAARITINAAGPFCDEVRQMANPRVEPMLSASQGSHVVLDRSFLPADCALLVPETLDGRVLFVIPWHGHTLVGTTDVPIPHAPRDPRASEAEIDFILETAGRYLARPPQRSDVLSTFAGVRPLVTGNGKNTASLSRDHTIRHDQPGLLTITGGKWTTYRAMAEECVDHAARFAGLTRRPCPTAELRLHGYSHPAGDDLELHGTDAAVIRMLIVDDPALGERLHPDLPNRAGEVVWAVRCEMARTVEDVLARRMRALFLNAAAAEAMAPRTAELMARELRRDAAWTSSQLRSFTEIARRYRAK